MILGVVDHFELLEVASALGVRHGLLRGLPIVVGANFAGTTNGFVASNTTIAVPCGPQSCSGEAFSPPTGVWKPGGALSLPSRRRIGSTTRPLGRDSAMRQYSECLRRLWRRPKASTRSSQAIAGITQASTATQALVPAIRLQKIRPSELHQQLSGRTASWRDTRGIKGLQTPGRQSGQATAHSRSTLQHQHKRCLSLSQAQGGDDGLPGRHGIPSFIRENIRSEEHTEEPLAPAQLGATMQQRAQAIQRSRNGVETAPGRVQQEQRDYVWWTRAWTKQELGQRRPGKRGPSSGWHRKWIPTRGHKHRHKSISPLRTNGIMAAREQAIGMSLNGPA